MTESEINDILDKCIKKKHSIPTSFYCPLCKRYVKQYICYDSPFFKEWYLTKNERLFCMIIECGCCDIELIKKIISLKGNTE